MSEQGHAKNLENFKRLKNFMTGWGANYSPTNGLLTTAHAATVAGSAESALSDVRDTLVPRKTAVAAREDVFAPAKQTAMRIVAMLEASGAPASAVEDARTFARKITGRRAKPKAKDNPATAVDESAASISASQQSYTQMVEAFASLVAQAAAQPQYDPNEDDLKIANLNALADQMRAANDAVIAADTAYSNALVARDQIFYADTTGLYDIAMTVKKYVRAAFGLNSSEYNQIKSLQFKKNPRR